MIDQKVINTWAKSQNLIPLHYGSDISLVILGENFNQKKHPKQGIQQEDLINIIKPTELLHEAFKGGTYNPNTQTFYDRDTGKTEDCSTKKTNPMIALSNKYKLILTGCSVTNKEYESIYDKIMQDDPSAKPDFTTDKECKEKQLIMGRNIVDRVSKSYGAFLAIIGAYNMRPKSNIHEILQKNNIGYVCIDQTGKYTDQNSAKIPKPISTN